MHLVTDSEVAYVGLTEKCKKWSWNKWVGSRGPLAHGVCCIILLRLGLELTSVEKEMEDPGVEVAVALNLVRSKATLGSLEKATPSILGQWGSQRTTV